MRVFDFLKAVAEGFGFGLGYATFSLVRDLFRRKK
jgi:hypothetical protein